MAYVPTTFVDRSVEFPNRRTLTAVPGQADTFDIARAEGTVFAEGTKPDAANLNAEFGKIKAETDSINTSLTAPIIGKFIYDYQNGKAGYNTSPTRGADTFHPFKNIELVDNVNNVLLNYRGCVFSRAANDSANINGRTCSRASSEPVFWFFATESNFYGWGVVGLTQEAVTLTPTSANSSSVYSTFTTTDGHTIYLASMSDKWSTSSYTVVVTTALGTASIRVTDAINTNLPQAFIDKVYKALADL